MTYVSTFIFLGGPKRERINKEKKKVQGKQDQELQIHKEVDDIIFSQLKIQSY